MVNSRPQRASKNHIDKTESWVTYRDGDCEWVVYRWGGEGTGVLEDWEISVKSLGKMGQYFCPHFLHLFSKILTEGAALTVTGAYSSIAQPSPKTLNLSFGGGSYLEEYFGAL